MKKPILLSLTGLTSVVCLCAILALLMLLPGSALVLR